MKAKTSKITGVIVPSAWTKAGKISKISILTRDENEYQIDLGKTGKELKKK